jgi:hypothetical protein
MDSKRKTLRFWLISGSMLAVLFAGIGFAATHCENASSYRMIGFD